MLAETESLLKALDEANVFVLNNICRTVRCPLPHCELTLIAGIGDKHKYETSKVGCVVSIQTGGSEAQNPKTFRVATFYMQKLSGRSARNHFS